jgi:hypothetical protein
VIGELGGKGDKGDWIDINLQQFSKVKTSILHQERLAGTNLMLVFKNKTAGIRILSLTSLKRCSREEVCLRQAITNPGTQH